MRSNRRPQLEHFSPSGVRVPEKTRAAREKNRVRQFVQVEIDRRELGDRSLLGKSKSERRAKVAGKTVGLVQVGRFKIAANPIAKCDNDRSGVVLEQRRGRHDAVKMLRVEPVGVQFRPDEFDFADDHLIGQRLPPGGGLLPNPVGGRETVIGIQTSIDAKLS